MDGLTFGKSEIPASNTRDDAALLSPAESHSFRMKRVVGTPTIKAKRLARSDTPDTVIMESDDLEIGKHDSQTFTPPMSPVSRKKELLEKRIEARRLFHGDEYDDDDKSGNGKITQSIFSKEQIKEIETECTKENKTVECKKNASDDSAESGIKYKKIETDVGRCLYAIYTQTNEDKLASFNPVWVNVGAPDKAKELLCLR